MRTAGQHGEAWERGRVEALPEDSPWLSFQLSPPEHHPSAWPGAVSPGRKGAVGGTSHPPALTRTPIPGWKPYGAKQLSLLAPPVPYVDCWAAGHLHLGCLPGSVSEFTHLFLS